MDNYSDPNPELAVAKSSLKPVKYQWLGAICPICNKEYRYRSDYKPVTCGWFDCIQEANKRGLLPRG